jgi:ABC-type antimicrobial peptide transport system permease subunit
VIGQTVCDELFKGESPLGKQVRIQNVPFTVVGVLTRKGASAAGEDQDDILLAPWTTIKLQVSASSLTQVNQSVSRPLGGSAYPGSVQGLYPSSSVGRLSPFVGRMDNVDLIVARSRSGDLVGQASSQISQLLRERHRIQPGQPEDVSVRDFSEIRQAIQKLLAVLSALLLSVALIALFIGGVGIMNIMLVSVTERTREIGLRLAVGASPSDILCQFLVEAVLLCLFGGAAGIGLGKGGSLLMNRLFDWTTQSSFEAVVAAVAVSVVVGLVFGFFPAWKASRLKPIEALRYE